MKTLAELKLLSGQTESITMTEFRNRPGEVIDQILQGKSFTITRAGKVVAVIHEPEPTAVEIGAEIRRLGLY